MSWNLLSLAVPLVSFYKVVCAISPKTYARFETAKESPYAGEVKAVVKRVFEAENKQGSNYAERMAELLGGVPPSAQPATVQSLMDERIRVIESKVGSGPICTLGTDQDALPNKGRYYISINPDHPQTQSAVKALPWIATHETCHILEEDPLDLAMKKTIASGVTTLASVGLFGWSLPVSFAAAISANILTHVYVSRRAEQRADDFANRHCSVEQRQQAISYFKQSLEFPLEEKRRKAISCLEQLSPLNRRDVFKYLIPFLESLSHPSSESRIKNIQNSYLRDTLATVS